MCVCVCVYVCVCSYLFWTEWGQYPRIERSRLDGSQRAVLVNVSISWPNGISIDYEVQYNRPFLYSYHDVTVQTVDIASQHYLNHYCLRVCRRVCCTGVMPGRTRLSASTWRLERTGKWCWPTTTWTCFPCLCLRATSIGVTGQINPHPTHTHTHTLSLTCPHFWIICLTIFLICKLQNLFNHFFLPPLDQDAC